VGAGQRDPPVGVLVRRAGLVLRLPVADQVGERDAARDQVVDDRLAEAVQAGTLTQAEADAVKKAAEKGVIGFGGPR